ncbi:touch insensitive larva B [Halictus rubicundus]|uniref:touch insensitive larva B n=1 Tax=Halictus rubicundus TaxID=77578 RepID=UPI0040371ACE
MPGITLDLIRKRSEHNEGEIATLEEIALHQENIDKIELLDRACRHLKILLLQNNLIGKIENLGRLKRLEYLNLALNNIEAIENLEGLESLKKLDLTVNFIGDLRAVRKLRCNENLEQLFLMGNPCADYSGYRDYTIATLPQLKELDGTVIERSERIKALQFCARIEGEIIRSYGEYRKTRENERIRGNAEVESNRNRADSESEDENDQFWKRVSRHTPEERVIIAERASRKEERRKKRDNRDSRPAYVPKLFSPEGRPYNTNQPKIPFTLNNDRRDVVVLEVMVYKYLDTDYVDVDVQPEYVRVTIKGKILQLTLPCEVSVEGSKAERNTTNGKLVVTMPRLDPLPIIGKREPVGNKKKTIGTEDRGRTGQQSSTTMREYLEIGPAIDRHMDFSRIVCPEQKRIGSPVDTDRGTERNDWDNPDVPPLE